GLATLKHFCHPQPQSRLRLTHPIGAQESDRCHVEHPRVDSPFAPPHRSAEVDEEARTAFGARRLPVGSSCSDFSTCLALPLYGELTVWARQRVVPTMDLENWRLAWDRRASHPVPGRGDDPAWGRPAWGFQWQHAGHLRAGQAVTLWAP